MGAIERYRTESSELTFFDDCGKERQLLELVDIRDHPRVIHLTVKFLLKAYHDIPMAAQLPKDI